MEHAQKSETPSLDTFGRWTDSLSVVVIRENFDNPLQPSRGMYIKGVAEFSPSLLAKSASTCPI